MLQYETIDPATLELLNKLMKIELFKGMRLVGGTSLALQIGHRNSVDLDFFGQLVSDEHELDIALNELGKAELLKQTRNIKIFLINDIKVDFVNYHYQWIDNALNIDNLRLAGIKNIAAMKLAAITGRGSKKDFIDIFFILKQFSLNELLRLYQVKYPTGSEIMVLKSLTYFADADPENFPKMFVEVSWDEIKQYITECVRNYIAKL